MSTQGVTFSSMRAKNYLVHCYDRCWISPVLGIVTSACPEMKSRQSITWRRPNIYRAKNDSKMVTLGVTSRITRYYFLSTLGGSQRTRWDTKERLY